MDWVIPDKAQTVKDCCKKPSAEVYACFNNGDADQDLHEFKKSAAALRERLRESGAIKGEKAQGKLPQQTNAD